MRRSSSVEGRAFLWAAYLTWGGVALVSLSVRRPPGETGLVLLFLAAFLLAFLLLAAGRDPRGVLGLATAATAGLLVLGPATLHAILFFVLSPTAFLLRPWRRALVWIGAFGTLTALAFVREVGPLQGMVQLIAYLGGYVFFAAFARALAAAEQARREAQDLLAELQEAYAQLQAYARRVEELAVAEERTRLAREMHDALGHRLTVAAVQLEGAQRLLDRDPGRAAQMLGTAREQVRWALQELRQTVAALRASPAVDGPLETALEELIRAFAAGTGLDLELHLDPDLPGLPSLHRHVLYRAVQEGLTNVQRHAGARRVRVGLERQGEGVLLRILDDGRGPPDPLEEGFGLRGLRERVERLGGRMALEPRPEGGARLRIWLPLPQEGGTDGADPGAPGR